MRPVSCSSPKLLLDEIQDYQPKDPASSDWSSLFRRVTTREEDGHASKLARALAYGAEVSTPFEKDHDYRIKHEMWLKMANMGKVIISQELCLQTLTLCL